MRCLLFFLALATSFQASSQFIRINECQASNGTSFIDEADDFDDWIELQNISNEEVDLGSWYITDDSENLVKWQFPDGPESILAPGDYLILFADNEEDEGNFHLNFSLKQAGEEIFLVKPDLNIEHQVAYSFCLQDFSWGYNENNVWSLLDLPSPGFENIGEGFSGAANRPGFSIGGQVLDAPISLELFAGENAQIYYTLDGSEPSNTSELYVNAISIETTTTVKAISIEPGKYNSLVNAQSYLFGTDLHNPIIHLSCLEELFNGPEGLDNQPYDDNELVLSACFFDESGLQVHQQTMGLKVHAADFRDQRSFRLYARGQYGESKLNLDVYPERDFDQHKRLVLRNAGNDGLEIGGSALRDPLISGLYQSIDPSYGASAYKPVNIFINEEYRGIYNLRERQDEDWLENVFNIEPDEVDFLERTAGESDTRNEISGVWDDYDSMESEAINNDLSVDENYQSLTSQLNLQNYIDYQSTEIFIVNQDWLSNNMKFWKEHDNGTWNYVIWDTDWGFGTFYPNYPHGFPDWNALNFALSNWGGWTSDVETLLLQNLVESPDFVDAFSTRSADLMNSYLRPDHVVERLLNMQDQIEPDIPAQVNRWGGSVGAWESEVEYMMSFIEDRPENVRAHFTERFFLGEIGTVTLDQLPEDAGYIEVNNIRTQEIPWSGYYYENIPVRLKAIPEVGYYFDHWEGEGIEGSTDQEIFINILDVPNATAVYMPEDDLPEVMITEIFYSSSGPDSSEDWLELYNAGPGTADLSGWNICGNGECAVLPNDLTLSEGNYLVLCQSLSAFQLAYPDATDAIQAFPFGLSSSAEELLLTNTQEVIQDQVNYTQSSPWPEDVLANHSIELLDLESDNFLGQNWVSQVGLPLGSPGEEYVFTPVNIEEFSWVSHISAFPNPFESTLALQLSMAYRGQIQIEIIDLSGRVLLSRLQSISAGEHTLMINDLDGLASGSYQLRISSDKGTQQIQLMKR